MDKEGKSLIKRTGQTDRQIDGLRDGRQTVTSRYITLNAASLTIGSTSQA